jgi:predicted AAA+ superfamily ATPase
MMYIPRILEQQVLRAFDNRKILLLLGARQVGKTTLLQHILRSYSGVLLNMDIAVDSARLRSAAKLSPHEAVRSLGATRLLVIDEAQRISQIGLIIKGWYDAGVAPKIILLGSSSATLLDTAAAELAGRNEKLWLTPLLLQEVLYHQEWFNKSLSSRQLYEDFSEQIRALLLQRIVFGGYPEAYVTNDPASYLTNLSSDYLLKDIFTASLVRSPEDVRRLLLELASRLGEEVAISQLAATLHLSRQTVQRYLDMLEGIFVIFRLPSYATDPIKEVNKSYKYYFWDTGIKNALQREWVVSENRSDMAALWENWVIAEIMKQSRTYRRQEDLFFWRSRNDSTVDLVVKQGSALHAFDIRFEAAAWRPSRSFERTYGVRPRLIHRDTILEFLL